MPVITENGITYKITVIENNIAEARKLGFKKDAKVKDGLGIYRVTNHRLIQDNKGNVSAMLEGKLQFIFLNGKWRFEVIDTEHGPLKSGHYWVQIFEDQPPKVLYYSEHNEKWPYMDGFYRSVDFFRIWKIKLEEPKWK